MTTSAKLILTKEAIPLLTPAQKTFNRLRMKIKSLQEKQKDNIHELDTALQFYYATIRPGEDLLCDAITERIKALYQFYTDQKYLSKKELAVLKDFIENNLDILLALNDGAALPSEIKEIFKALKKCGPDGICNCNQGKEKEEEENDNDKKNSENLTQMKDDIRDKLKKKFGIDVDLSDIDMTLSQDEIMWRLFQSIDKAAENQKSTQKKTNPSKKMQEKEQKRLAFEEMQKKSLNSIYKELSRVLHPDLEQDSEKKIWKEELMKKLTISYKNKDLYTLLILETEWINRSTEQIQLQSDEQINLYNSMLKEQQKTLQHTIDTLFLNPKYIPIQRFYRGLCDMTPTLKSQYKLLKKDLQNLQQLSKDLQGPDAIKILKSLLKKRQTADNMSDIPS